MAATLLGSSAQAALVSACTGASLPPSALTSVLTPLVSGIFGNPLLSFLLPGVGTVVGNAVAGDPISLDVINLGPGGGIVSPADSCATTSDSFQLDTAAGIAIGGNSITGLGSGAAASAATLGSIAFGNGAATSLAATDSVALGAGAQVTAANSIAVGAGSRADRGALVGYTAPGVVGTATSTGEFSVGDSGALRQITNVAPGSAPTDAANVGQLATAVSISAAAAPVQYSDPGTPLTPNGGTATNDVTLVGGAVGPVTIHNVAAGSVAPGSTDAVNGDQLSATNTNVTNNASSITNLTTNINNGTTGLVQQTGGAPGVGQITVGAATGGTSVTVAGTDGDRVISGVANGVAPSDAVNLSQLSSVGSANANAVLYDVAGGVRQNSATLVGGVPGTVLLTNVTPGDLSAASTDAVNGSQLFATNGQVTTNTTAIATTNLNVANNTSAIANTNLTVAGNVTAITNLNNGTAGLVRQVGGAPGIGLITVGAETGGTEVSVAGTSGTRTISGVTAGVAGTDAVNVSQLSAVGAGNVNAVQYDTLGGIRQNSVTLAGGLPGVVRITNVAPADLSVASTDAVNGAQLFATNGLVTTNTTAIANTNIAVAGNVTAITNLNNGTAGLVRQVGGAPGVGLITVGAETGGTEVSVAGTSGTRTISGVTAGVAGTDAVNVSQLNAVGAGNVNAVQYDTVGGVRQNSVTLTGGAAGPVTVTNVADGALNATSSDAVNGAQLFATNTQVTTNTTDIANLTTTVSTNTTNIANNTTAITNLTNGTSGIVQQTGGTPGAGTITVGAATAGNLVDVTGTDGTRTVTGVTAGAVTAASTDAVNGGQLFATNTSVSTNTTNIANNTTAIAGNTTSINNLTTGINNGSVGLVQQVGGAPGEGQLTVGAATGGTSVTVTGTSGDRTITGVAAGLAANDAATVGQLGMVTGGAFNAVQYDTDALGGRLNSVTLTGGQAGPVTVTNVAAGALAAGSTDAVNGGQLAATNANVAGNTTTINNIVAGNAGAFRSNNAAGVAASSATGANSSSGGFGASATGTRSVALGNSSTSSGTNSVALGAGSTDGGVANVVSIGSVGGERRLTNVGPGLNGTDAVNLSQLQSQTAQFAQTTTGLQNQINSLDFDLSRFKRRANAGTAGAMAVAALPQPFTEGAGMVGGAMGYWQGQVAFAIGVSKIVSDSAIVKAGASVSGRGTGGFNAGVGFQF